MEPRKEYRIFISSPSDVGAERQRVERVVARLGGEIGDAAKLTVIRWETSYYTADKDFQAQIVPPSQTDVVLCILWKRLGSPLPQTYRRDDGSTPTGTEFEFEDAMKAARERGAPDVLTYRKTAEVLLSAERLDQERAQWLAFNRFWKQWFVGEAGHFIAGYHDFATTDEFEALVEQHLRQWLERRGVLGAGAVVWPIERLGSPFRGLEPFDEDHAAVFFGRRRVVEQLRERLSEAERPFLLVLGMSGAGKSSLVRAGLAPRLRQPGAVPGVDAWRRATIRPTESGGDLLLGLGNALYGAEALAELAAGDNATPADFAALARAAPLAAANAVRQSLKRVAAALQRAEGFDRPAEVRLLLVVDQLEEIFQFARDGVEAFAAALAALVRAGGVWVVATMRSDFYAEFQSLAELVALKGEGLSFDLAPPSPAEIEEIVRAPAKAAGLSYQRRAPSGVGLDDELIAAARQPGSLPLLQFTLDELFNDRDRSESALTIAAYDRLGGLEGAIERRAEAAFGALEASAQGELPALLREMVTWAGMETASGRVGRRERLVKPQARARLLEAFVAARLLIADGPWVRLAHEAFITRWPRAAALIEADREFLRARARVEAAETQWRQEGRRAEFLLPRGRPLAEAVEILAQRREALDAEAIAFIEASQAAENARLEEERRREAERLRAEEAAKRKRLERFAVVVSVLLLIAVGAAVYALDQRRLAIDRAVQAEHNFALALDATSDLVARVQAGGMTVNISHNLLTAAQDVLDRLKSIEDAPAVGEARVRLLDAFVLLHLREGRTSQAVSQAREAESIARPLAAQNAPDPKAAPLLASALERVGEAEVASGALAQAAVEFEQARAFADPAAAADPGDGARQDLRSLVHRGLGDVSAARGDIGGALNEFETAVSALDRPAIATSDNAIWKRDLAYARMRVADALLTQGDFAKGVETYGEAADAMQAISDQFPADGGHSAALALARRGQGDAQARVGDWQGAIKAYQTALAIEQVVAAKDPSSALHVGNYAVTHAILGDALRETKDPTGALDHLQTAIAILAPLVAADPTSSVRKAQLALAYRLRGRAELEKGDAAAAAQDFQDAMTLWRDLVALDPTNARWRFGLASSEVGAAAAASRGGDRAAARAHFETAIAAMQSLSGLDPANADWRRALETGHLRLGETLTSAKDPAGARREFEAALAIARGLAEARPDNRVWRNEADAIGARLSAGDGADSAPK